MWSGPRNISTALMRSFESRADCVVVDEPFYAFYLERTGIDHPGRDDVLASQPTDWHEVLRGLDEPLPGGARIQYQKQMVHHLLDEVDRDWMAGVRHAFLIRDPRRMLASYARKRESVRLEDLGLREELDLFRWLCDRDGKPPPVLDAHDLRADPPRMLARLCDALGIPFDPAMLRWAPGPRASDGIWAPHWYDAVLASTGFHPETAERPELPRELEALFDLARPFYDELAAHRL
ncbi:MAG TPA: HAD family hydrolase [Planctomycetes bacterium]|nr:HAD family hydrolase [Planctomycetota bacterium]